MCLICWIFMIFYCCGHRLKCRMKHKKFPINFHNISYVMRTVVVGREKSIVGKRKYGGLSVLMSSVSAQKSIIFPSSENEKKAYTQTFPYWSPSFSSFPFPRRVHVFLKSSSRNKLKANTCWWPPTNRSRHLLVKLRALNTQAIKHLFKITNRSA